MSQNKDTGATLPSIERKGEGGRRRKEKVVMLDKGVDHYVTCCPQLHHEVQSLTHSVLGLEAKIDLLLKRIGRMETTLASK